MGDTVNTLGFETDVTVVQAIAPQNIDDDTPVVSAAIDTRTEDRRRKRMLLVASHREATATAHTMAFTVTESATSDGEYTAATTSGVLTASSASAITRVASIRRNHKKPFIKVTATGSHGDADFDVAAAIVFL